MSVKSVRVVRMMLAIAVLTGSVGLVACSFGAEEYGPTLAVLDSAGKRVLLVDLESGDVRRTVNLRSCAWDIAADPGRGEFVTAQGGGVGADADNSIAIIDARRRRRVRYVELPYPNPLGVEVFGSGRVLVDHGFMQKSGMFVCNVNTRTREVVRKGHVPDNNIPLTLLNGMAWSSGVDIADGTRSLRRVDPRTLSSVEVLALGDFPMVLTSYGEDLYGWLTPEPGRGSIARFDGRTAAVEASRVVDLEGGCGQVVAVRGRIVAADWGTDDPAQTGSSIRVFDPDTLELERTIRVPGGACDLIGWRDRVIAMDFKDTELLIIDPVSGVIERSIPLPRLGGVSYHLALIDG